MMMDDTTREALLNKVCATLGEQEASMMSGLISENKALKEENEQLKQHNQVLRLKVDAMARKLFGKSSEKLDPAQLQMVFDALKKQPEDVAKKDPASDSAACDSEAEPATALTSAKRKKRTLEQIIEGLPVSEVIIDPPEVKAQPEAWTCMGAEVTKLIDYIPGKFACQHLVRRKYVRKDARHRALAHAARPLHRHTQAAGPHPHPALRTAPTLLPHRTHV